MTQARQDLLTRWGFPALLLLLLLLWQLSTAVFDSFVVASPAAAVQAIVEGYQAGWLLNDLWITLTEAALGFLLAALGGIWLGFVFGLSRFWGDVFQPAVLGLYSLPKVTLYPIFLFLFGLGISSKVAFAMFHGIFPITVFTMNSVRDIRPVLLKVGRSLGLSRWQTFRYIIVPAVLPTLATGLRFGVSTTFLGTVVGEMFAAKHGLGFQLVTAMTLNQVPKIFALILVLVVLALLANGLMLALERRLSARRPARMPAAEHPEAGRPA